MKFQKIHPEDNEYLKPLLNISSKPEHLFYYGTLPNKRTKTVAIVGSRKNTHYGEEIAYHLAYEVAKKGGVVVSGLAYGIDSIAHTGAVDAGGITIGILGTEIENIYPKSHLNLAKRIIELGGSVMSEWQEGDKFFPGKNSFLMRNRIISGLSDVVIVVEAAIKSGSLNTAMHAIEQGKTLFSVPGNITNPYSQGCNKLLKQGAEVYTNPSDILDLLFPPEKKKKAQLTIFGDNNEETLILEQLSKGITDGSEIIEITNLSTSVFNQTITILEIKDRVRSSGANQWYLK